jgi:rhodanese-related sulfurtransferase
MPRQVDREEVRRLIAAGAQVVEVLPSSEYDEDHIPGAINLPLSKIDAGVTDVLRQSDPVVVYCWDTA